MVFRNVVAANLALGLLASRVFGLPSAPGRGASDHSSSDDPPTQQVSSASIGFRFKERSIVRFPSPERKPPIRPFFNSSWLQSQERENGWGDYDDIWLNDYELDDWKFGNRRKNRQELEMDEAEARYYKELEEWSEQMKDRSRWIVKAEESIVFEDSYPIQAPEPVSELQGVLDSVTKFALAVPAVNLPPLQNEHQSSISPSGNLVKGGSESRYEYFVSLTFSNGTFLEVPAGTTFFQVQGPPSTSSAYQQPIIEVTKPLKTYGQIRREEKEADALEALEGEQSSDIEDGEWDDDESCGTEMDAEMVAEVRIPQGGNLKAGGKYNVTVTLKWDGAKRLQPNAVELSLISSIWPSWSEKEMKEAGSPSKHIRELTARTTMWGSPTTTQTLWQDFDLEKRKQKDPMWMIERPGNLGPGAAKDVEVSKNQSVAQVVLEIRVPISTAPDFIARYIERGNKIHVRVFTGCDTSKGIGGDDPSDSIEASIDEWTSRRGKELLYRTGPRTAEVEVKVSAGEEPLMPIGYEKLPGSRPLVDYLSPEARAPHFHDPNSKRLPKETWFLKISDVTRLASEDPHQDLTRKTTRYTREACDFARGLGGGFMRGGKYVPRNNYDERCGSGDAYVGASWFTNVFQPWAMENKIRAKKPGVQSDDALENVGDGVEFFGHATRISLL
ncbi:hypothetical protein IE53DRAFT_360412 [Violaceomyces palustris]|uniref:Uncharacterized protein n=1 Tax=Violaceomyces palustris TaxID=1673888 RepID=A0ACD0P4C8_9BASI|nr:hypothetical protein IE53DRAFT_360412 [Violaceomyces palustris]